MLHKLNEKFQFYADTREEAEKFAEECKANKNLTEHKISEKHNKHGTYYVIDVKNVYNVPREIMEDGESTNVQIDVIEGQTSIDDFPFESVGE